MPLELDEEETSQNNNYDNHNSSIIINYFNIFQIPKMPLELDGKTPHNIILQ